MRKIGILAMVLSLVVGLSTFVLPQDEKSELEGRYLEYFPQIKAKRAVTGLAMEDIEDAFNDQLTFRNNLFGFNSTLLDSLKVNYRNGIFVGEDKFLFNGIAYEPKSFEELESVAEEKFNNLAKIKESTPTDSLFIFTSIFSKNMVYEDKLPNNYLTSGYNTKTISNLINDKIRKSELEIEIVDGTQTLINNKEDYVYFYTDHHYTGLGAYYIYKDILSVINHSTKWDLSIPDYVDFDKGIVPGDFVGSQSRILGNIKYSEIDYLEIAIPQNMPSYTRWDNGVETNAALYNFSDKNSYSNYMGSDWGNTVVKTDNPASQPKILIIGDSFTNALEVLAVYNSSEMHSLDPRHVRVDIFEYIEEIKPDITIVVRDTLLDNNHISSGEKK